MTAKPSAGGHPNARRAPSESFLERSPSNDRNGRYLPWAAPMEFYPLLPLRSMEKLLDVDDDPVPGTHVEIPLGVWEPPCKRGLPCAYLILDRISGTDNL